MFKNKQLKELFKTDLDSFFDTRLDDIFNYKKVAPITYKRKIWEKYNYQTTGIESKSIDDISDWNVAGNTGWKKVNDYFTNNDVTDNQTATIYKTFHKILHIEFYYKVSSENGYDFLTIYINGEQKANISGEVDWTLYTQDFNEETDVEVKFTYSKDGSESAG
jgi:hypothetical protein